MFESLIVVFIFLVEFTSFIYAAERLKVLDSILLKSAESLTEKDKMILVKIGVRSFIAIIYVILLIYCLWIPHLFWYSLITFCTAIVVAPILKEVSNRSLQARILVVRIDIVITMLIWLTPFLEIINRVF